MRRLTWLLKTADWKGYRSTLARMMENTDKSTSCLELIKAIHVSTNENIKKTNETIPEGKLKWMSPEIREEIRGCPKGGTTVSTITDNRQKTAGKGTKADERRTKKSWEEFIESKNEETTTSEIWKKIRKISGKKRTE
jgi:hypothetical protein